MPWAGIEKTQLESLNYADVKAAEKMARLYDEIVKHNTIEDEQDVRNLNVFFSRLLFCFFAEDTRVFEEGSFTDAIASLTQAGGSDTDIFLRPTLSRCSTRSRVTGQAQRRTFRDSDSSTDGYSQTMCQLPGSHRGHGASCSSAEHSIGPRSTPTSSAR